MTTPTPPSVGSLRSRRTSGRGFTASRTSLRLRLVACGSDRDVGMSAVAGALAPLAPYTPYETSTPFGLRSFGLSSRPPTTQQMRVLTAGDSS
jgi:hypothetical protein